DVPLSEQNKPTTSNTTSPKDPISYQPVPKVKQPTNWVPFSKRDANALEQAYRSGIPGTKVPCNEDYLFEVDIDKREIHPVYWSGPIYEVRRGTWFQQADLNKYIPCDENLAMQIEEGYKKHQAWIPSPESDLNSPATSEAPVEKEKERRWALLGKYLSQYYAYQKSNDDAEKRKKEEMSDAVNKNISGFDAEQQRDIKQEAVETHDYENEESECEERVIDHLILNNTSETPQNSNMKSGSNTSTSSSRRNSVLSDKCTRSGVQVLPILWREEIKFGIAADDENFQRDLGLPKTVEEGKTTLSEITLDGVPTLRLMISDVLMDVLLYMTPRYREIMINTVTNEANRIYNLFIQRNPKFLEVGGKVSLIGHSLGSVLAFDVLCHQPPIPSSINELSSTSDSKRVDESFFKLDFPVQNFFSAGRLKIGSRKYYENDKTSDGDVNLPLSEENNIPLCYPKVRNIYNLFHNADPIAYRLEPLIARHYGSSLKPALIPYQKGGLKAVHLGIQEFGTEIANKATNIFSSVKTSLMFTRGLQSLMQQNSNTSHKRSSSIPSINTEVDSNDGSALTNYPPTQYAQPPSPATHETVAKEKDDPIGAAKLKSLNITGRVDYVLQEGILDVSYINAITAHMCYWTDLDAVSFVLREIYREEPEDE
ncbi:19211_t:CDS:10, partial [Gigaspora margarita]